MPDIPVIHINHEDYPEVTEQLSAGGYLCFVKVHQTLHIPQGHYAIGRATSIEGGVHPLWVLYDNVKLCA